jgi:uncharacterized protein
MRKTHWLPMISMVLAFGHSDAAQTVPAPAAAAVENNGCPAPGERPFRPAGAGAQGAPRSENIPPQAAPAGPRKKRLLIWADTQNGIAQHDIAHAEAIIEEMGYTSGLYDSYIRTDSSIISKRPKMTDGKPASGGPSLCNVDAIFFLGHREINLDDQGRADLLWFVHDEGKGFVASHTGVGAFESWPEFGELIGARFDNHPWGTITAHLTTVDPKFPGMEFKTGDEDHDEFYQLSNFHADQIHVILRMDTSVLDMTRSTVHPGESFALAYAKMYGKGRVFYSSLGHGPAMWDDPRVRDMYLGAIKWALGLVDADITPNQGAGTGARTGNVASPQATQNEAAAQ